MDYKSSALNRYTIVASKEGNNIIHTYKKGQRGLTASGGEVVRGNSQGGAKIKEGQRGRKESG